MKRSQLTAFALALAIMLAVALVPDLLGGHTPAPSPANPQVTLEGSDTQGEGHNQAGQEQGTDEGAGTQQPAAPGDDGGDDVVTSPELPTVEPISSGQAGNAPPTTQTSPQEPEPSADLGPDIELGEGITDARAQQAKDAANVTIYRDGTYTSKVEVALYIHTYGRVPSNYVSKTKARNAGWVSSEGNLWDVLPGMSIGGGGYTNEQWGDEPLLPETPEGRDWRECDINYQGGYRGAERLVYSDDGLVFYTGDHYTTFERLY